VFAWSTFTPAATPKPSTAVAPATSAPLPRRAPSPKPPPAPAPTAEPPPPSSTAAIPGAAGRAPALDALLEREVAQLGRIKQLLPHAPQQAYRLAQAGHREFRAGMLRQEREGLAILALWQLARGAEAGQRTRAFLARYPESPLREQLAQRLERAGEPPAQEQ
jgi:hypothetical protein